MSPSLRADSIPPMPLPTTRASYFMRVAFRDGPRPARDVEYSCMYLVNGSAQTEQIAAMRTRCGS